MHQAKRGINFKNHQTLIKEFEFAQRSDQAREFQTEQKFLLNNIFHKK